MVKVNSKSQRGRSMVEMLGVLAIIGVLSVGGVYGYGVAMKKHKANELLHQASMLATTISAQIMSDKPLGNITDFGSGSNGTFSETVGTPNDEQFTLQITDVDEAVCKQLQSMNGGMVRQVECGTADTNGKTTATLKFNNDLTSKAVAGDYNDDTTGKKCTDAGYQWCGGSCKKDCCDGKCTAGQTCVSGTCMNSECKNSDCSCINIGKASDECSADKPYCVVTDESDGTCVATAEGAKCQGNPSQCSGTDAPYCADEGFSCSKTPTNVFCYEDKDCIDLGYCISNRCHSSAVGHSCDDRYDCGGDAPYCNATTLKCSKDPEGAWCSIDSDCGSDYYCIDRSGSAICYSTAVGLSCNWDGHCGGDAPYCVNEVCSKTPA